MPNYVIQLIVNNGAAVVNINNTTNALNRATNAAREFNRVMAMLGAGSVIRTLVKLSDTYTQVQNRLRFVTSSSRELALMTDKTFKVAQENRVAWEALTTTYARVRKATIGMGLSAQDSITIVSRLSKAIKLNGSSVQETTSTLRQFGQALSKGKLNGDEFVSLMENARPVMDLVAKSMGKTHGQLFRLAKQGKITGEILANALLGKAGQSIDEAASKQVVTLAERWVQVKNAATRFVGESPSIQGAIKAISGAIGGLVDNFDDAGRAILVVIELLAVGFAVRAVQAVVTGLRALTIAAATNPFTAMAIALGGLVVLAYEFRKELSAMVVEMGKMTHEGERVMNASGRSNVGQGLNRVVQQGTNERTLAQVREARELVDLFGGLEAARQKAKETFNQDLMDSVEIVERFAGGMATAASRSFQEILNRFKGDMIKDGFVKIMQDSIKKIQEITDEELMRRTGKKQAGQGPTDAEIKKITNEFERLREKTNNAAKVYYDLRDAQIALNKAVRLGIVDLQEAQLVYDKLHDSIADVNAQVTAAAANPVVSGALFGAGNNLPKSTMERTDLLLSQDADRTKAMNSDLFKDSLGEQKRILEELRPGEQDRINRLVAMNKLLADQTISQAQYNKLLEDLTKKEMLAGVKKLDEEFVILFGNMEDALADFLYTGEFGFRKMVDSMLRDISRLLARQLILGAIGAASGASYGNWISTGAAAIGGAAANGVDFTVGGSTPGVDKSMAAFRVTPGERVTITTPKQQARQMRDGSGRGGMTVVNALDPRQVPDMLNTPAGRRAMADAVRVNPSIVARRTK